MKRLAFVIQDESYLHRVAKYVKRQAWSQQWTLLLFTSMETYEQHRLLGGEEDFLVVEQTLATAAKHMQYTIPVAILAEQMDDERLSFVSESSHMFVVKKIQPLPFLLPSLMDGYALRSLPVTTTNTLHNKQAAILAVYSPVSNCGKTTFSLHLAAVVAAQYRVIYLNLERWNSSLHWLETKGNEQLEQEPKGGMSTLLYSAKKQANGQLCTRWLTAKKYHPQWNFDYFDPFHADDRSLLQTSDVIEMIATVQKSQQYDYIIIDLPSLLTEVEWTILQQANRVLWLTEQHALTRWKEEQLIAEATQQYGEMVQEIWNKKQYIMQKFAAKPENKGHLHVVPNKSLELPYIMEWRLVQQAALFTNPLYRAAVHTIFSHMIDSATAIPKSNVISYS